MKYICNKSEVQQQTSYPRLVLLVLGDIAEPRDYQFNQIARELRLRCTSFLTRKLQTASAMTIMLIKGTVLIAKRFRNKKKRNLISGQSYLNTDFKKENSHVRKTRGRFKVLSAKI